MAPELLAPEKFGKKNCRPTQPADIYAFGTVIYEILTGRNPFYDQTYGQHQFTVSVLGGKRPTKPEDMKTIGFGSGTWELVEECWKEESTERPTTERVIAHLARVAESSTIVGPTPKMPYNSSDDSLKLDSSSTDLFTFSNHDEPSPRCERSTAAVPTHNGHGPAHTDHHPAHNRHHLTHNNHDSVFNGRHLGLLHLPQETVRC